MATALVQIDGAPGSNTTLQPGQTVTFSNQNNTGVTTWKWELLDIPAASSATLTAPTAATTNLTLDKQGSYLVRLTVNEGLATQDINAAVAAIRQVRSRIRVPAAGESLEVNATDGWAAARNRDLIKLDELLSGGATQMGALINADTPPDTVSWKRGDLVAMETVVDINSSAGDATVVPVWRKPESVTDPVTYGFVYSDLDGASTFSSTGNIPGLATYHGIYVVINGFVKSAGAACLNFTNVAYFPHGVVVGDPLYATTASPNQLTNFADHFGTEHEFEGGSVSAHVAFPDEARLVGYVTQVDASGSVFVSPAADRNMRTGPTRFTHGIVSHSIRLGGVNSPTGDYHGRAPLNTYAGAIEYDCFDILHGAPAFAQFDMVSLIPSVTALPNSRDGLLSALLTDPSNPMECAQIGMITDLGSAPNTGGTMKATLSGYVLGCAAVFPAGTIDGETLYLDPVNAGKLAKFDDISDAGAGHPVVIAGRVILTGFMGGIFAVGHQGAPVNWTEVDAYPPGFIVGGKYRRISATEINFNGLACRDVQDTINLEIDDGDIDATTAADKDAFTGTGTVSIAGSSAITGAGTAFLTEFGGRVLTGTSQTVGTTVTGDGDAEFANEVWAGDLIGTAANGYSRVLTVDENDQLTLDTAIPGGNLPASTVIRLIENPIIGVGAEYLPINTIASNTAATAVNSFSATVANTVYTISEPRCTAANAHVWVYIWAGGGTATTKLIFSTQRTTPFMTAGYTTGRLVGVVPLQNGGFDRFQCRISGTRVEMTQLQTQTTIKSAGSDTSFTSILWKDESTPAIADMARFKARIQYDGSGALSDAELHLSVDGNEVHTTIQVGDTTTRLRGSQDGIWIPSDNTGKWSAYKVTSSEYDAYIDMNGFSFDRDQWGFGS